MAIKIPINEVKALGNITSGLKVLEFGNKKNSSGVYRDWYIAKGINYTSTDINGLDGAIIWDVRENPPKEILKNSPYDIITNFGFSEHVETDKGQEMFWKNANNLITLGGKLALVLPQPGYWLNHGKAVGCPGIYYPYEQFYIDFAKQNGYEIEDIWQDTEIHLNCCRLRKTEDKQFIMVQGLHKNLS